MDNETLITKILQCDFPYYCERHFQKIVINGETLKTSQILTFNENFLGTVTKVQKKDEKTIVKFFNQLMKIARNISTKEDFE